MRVDDYDDGVPSWVDLAVPDPEKARSFYAALFGWTIPEGPPEAGGYAVAELDGAPVAGVGPQMSPGAPAAWMTYVNVDDADEVVARVKANGGSVFVEPMDVMDVGRMAVFADPQGAVLGLWQPRRHRGAGIVNEPNTYCWSELSTTDVDAAKAFYSAVFGWGADTQAEDAMPGGYTEWKVQGRSVGGMMRKPDQVPAEVPPSWLVYFAVADADASATRATELGAAVLMAPFDMEAGRMAVLADPQGAAFALLRLKPELEG